ncbi:MAG: hypothetical protein JWM62_2484 [Frankiales bacterium]|nr:hypothetical protein [Frankiales bacterium]
MRVTVLVMEIRWCAECMDEKAFEVPPCADGHGADCLDLSCVECGFAIVVGIHDEVVVVEYAAA